MKKIFKLIAILLVVSILFSVCGCSAKKQINMEVTILPTPKVIKTQGEGILFKATIANNKKYEKAIDAFIGYSKELSVSFSKDKKATVDLKEDTSLQSGEYKISITKKGAVLYFSDNVGINHAFSSLLQLLEPYSSKEKVYLPICEIKDKADASYRGMMIDLARDWHDFSYLLSYVDMCYYYKVSVLHLHFTDNQSYTLPSEKYPKLSTVARSYTKEQIAQLVEYANARGVELMPEIDVPGHSKIFQNEYGEIFGNNLIHIHEDSISAMKSLFTELCEMFPYSKYIHIGGDEASTHIWGSCSKCQEYAQNHSETAGGSPDEMLAYFVNEMANTVFECGKQPICWEGFAKETNDMVRKDLIVMAWENYYQIAPDLLEAGFKIINCSWNPMYVVTPTLFWTEQEVFNWSIYQWKAVHDGSPYRNVRLEIEPNKLLQGGQLLAWGDQIENNFSNSNEGAFAERALMIERIPYLSENTWNVEKQITYIDMVKAVYTANEKLNKLLEIK